MTADVVSIHALDQVDWADPFSYIREMYGVRAEQGRRVEFGGRPGTITGARDNYLLITLDTDTHALLCHPTWAIRYLDEVVAP